MIIYWDKEDWIGGIWLYTEIKRTGLEEYDFYRDKEDCMEGIWLFTEKKRTGLEEYDFLQR